MSEPPGRTSDRSAPLRTIAQMPESSMIRLSRGQFATPSAVSTLQVYFDRSFAPKLLSASTLELTIQGPLPLPVMTVSPLFVVGSRKVAVLGAFSRRLTNSVHALKTSN